MLGVVVLFIFSVSACSLMPAKPAHDNMANTVKTAEHSATPQNAKILNTARTMSLINKEIIKGSCWDYINEVFNRAGYPLNKRKTVFKGHIHKGPYAHEQIQAGDWVYFKNYNYKNNPHSSIFVQWKDKANKQALMLSYAGERRKQPARYKVYDLRSAYQIIRAE